jgi:hypothetical protein
MPLGLIVDDLIRISNPSSEDVMEYSRKAVDVFHPELRRPLFLQPELRWNEAALCAELSRLAYFRFEVKAGYRDDVVEACKAAKLQQATFFNDPGTHTQAFAVLRANGSRAYVAFRGTQPDQWLDYWTDAQILLQPWHATQMVHDGFLRAYRQSSIKDAIAQQLLEWKKRFPDLQVTYTGHSLGAALATLAAADTSASTLVTFGSPRVGNAEFALSLAGKATISRYVDCCDGVTEIPPCVPLLLPYEHVGGRHYIDSQRKVWTTLPDADVQQDRRAVGLDAFLLPQFLEALRHAQSDPQQGDLPRILSDHAMINYILPLLALPAT